MAEERRARAIFKVVDKQHDMLDMIYEAAVDRDPKVKEKIQVLIADLNILKKNLNEDII